MDEHNTNNHCDFNRYIDCDTHKCNKCGWCPEVSKKRIEAWKKQNKAMRKK